MNLKLIKYTNANALEATWFNRTITPAVGVDGEEGYRPEVVTDTQVRCHAYADTQMQMLRDDAAVMGTPLGDYEDLIAEVESGIPPVIPLPPVVPASCTRRQGRLALLSAGYLEAVEAAIPAIADPTAKRQAQIEYEADTWERSNPFLQQMWANLGGTPAELDALFIDAVAR